MKKQPSTNKITARNWKIKWFYPGKFFIPLLVIPFLVSAIPKTYGQSEVAPWGNFSGIRVEGQLMEFESSLRIVGKDWKNITSTGKEKQRTKYTRQGATQQVFTNMDSLFFTETVEDVSAGVAKVVVQFTSRADTNILGAFFHLTPPAKYFSENSIQMIVEKGFVQTSPKGVMATGIRFLSESRELEIAFDKPTLVIVRKEQTNGSQALEIYLPIHQGAATKGLSVQKAFTIKANGEIDRNPIHLTLNTAQQGRAFDGLGGNFRIQNPKTDPQVIDYSLKNLRVAWGRVEMPWRFWQPEKDVNPIEAAKAGNLHAQVLKAMEMAQRLQQMNIPIILSAWSGPRWSVVGEPKFRPGADGVWGNPLNPANMDAIYQSIADYILYLKENYGVEIQLFSFNESDLGINIRMTKEEHAEFIKGLGAYFVSKGLKTKMLLGDNSDATTYEFIYPAMKDPKARPYIGAISFHSWRGWEKETLEKWASAATQLQVPLLVGEGSIDAAAWNYPAVFEEPTYAREEINLYTRLLAICQPQSILQWQLTADYSPMVGGGIFGNNEPLRPTQRFWNLKQLASTPKGLYAMPISNDRPDVSAAALGDNAKGTYAIHLVNNGTTRKVTLSGIPNKVKSLRVYITDKERAMKEGQRVSVTKGQALFTLDSGSFTSLISE